MAKPKSTFTPAGQTGTTAHALSPHSPNCPKCGSTPNKHTVKNYNQLSRDGDVVCTVCGTKVRDYDAD